MKKWKIYQILAVMIFISGLLVGVPAVAEAPACGSLEALGSPEALGNPLVDAEINDYIPDQVEVPALGADIASVQALENVSGESAESNANAEIFAQSSGNSPAPGPAESSIVGAGALPASYDARSDGHVTSVKDQGSYGNTCWAFSAVAMAESGLLANNQTVGGESMTKDTLDLAEMHLAYYFYHTPEDPLGNTTGDATIPLGDYQLVGGNHIFTTFALANWAGLAMEAKIDGIDWDNDAPDIRDYPNDAHMQKAYWINLSEDISNVKRLIQEYGSVAISMNYLSNYYCSSTSSYYYSGASTSVNHAVSLIGWDDTYSRNNFDRIPSQDGAWLVKNSYGEEFGDGGYFWISYDDRALKQSTAKAFVFDFEDATNYQYIYQYDGSAGAYMEGGAGDTGYRVASGDSIANIFTVPQDTKTTYQLLEAVSFALYAVNVDYSVQVYKNLTDSQNPCSGTPLLPQPVQGRTSFVGYYTVSLPEAILLNGGDTFSVVVTLSKSNGGNVSYFVDKTYQNGNWISFVNQTNSGQSYTSQNGNWQDLSVTGATARVKAFTNDYLVPTTQLTIDTANMALWKGEKATLSAAILPENASYQSVAWSSSNSTIVTVSETGQLEALKPGTATITAQAKDNASVAATCQITVRQPVEKIRTSSWNISCIKGETLTLSLTYAPAGAGIDGVSFKSLQTAIATVDKKGVVTAKRVGTTDLQVYSTYNDELLGSFTLTVTQAATEPESENDDDDVKMVNTNDTVDSTGIQANKVPNTGDMTNIVGWIWAIFCGAGIMMVETIWYRKKRKNIT